MRKPLIIFYFLFFYATAQLIWWGILLVKSMPEQKIMIIGEGIFFMIIFILGALRLKTAFVREHKMQKQQHNFMLAVTHELKSPLASIKLYIQTILKRDLNKEQQQQFLCNSLKDIERLDDLVENVLIATKLENLRAHFPKEKFNFSELVTSIAGRLQINACTHQVIMTDIAPEVYVEGDKFALTNVVTNLIENAIKYSPECAKVDVIVKQEGGQIHFFVKDQGSGIEDEEKKRIFNKFYRVGNESTRTTKGTGLGLFIVKSVLDRHQAQIRVKDNVPQGTIFEVIFN
jgi:two-component system phosphate regulon sensor histidine kinase PhoR